MVRARIVPGFVTLPQDRRAKAVAEAVMSKRDDIASLHMLSQSAGASVRTVERAFRRETGLSFEAWRRQFRLMKAIGLLVEGRTVKEVAFEIGYLPADRIRRNVPANAGRDTESLGFRAEERRLTA
jgi:transcriptional regulator GlxA family with amidase domain